MQVCFTIGFTCIGFFDSQRNKYNLVCFLLFHGVYFYIGRWPESGGMSHPRWRKVTYYFFGSFLKLCQRLFYFIFEKWTWKKWLFYLIVKKPTKSEKIKLLISEFYKSDLALALSVCWPITIQIYIVYWGGKLTRGTIFLKLLGLPIFTLTRGS